MGFVVWLRSTRTPRSDPLACDRSWPWRSGRRSAWYRPPTEIAIANDDDGVQCRPRCPLGWRGAHQYLTFFPPFVRAFAGAAFGLATADRADDDCAVAMCSSVSDEEEIDAGRRAFPSPKQADVNVLFEQMGEFHPTQDHWYLPLIGVDFARQSRGHGSRLLSHALERCDTDGLPAYLEATTPRQPGAVRVLRLRGPRCDPGRRFAADVADAAPPPRCVRT